ncbi:MAG: hypothetical protein Q8934_08950 [Bacillota bacterium]|nr:hypothetical protein [Bacillota bacterium]
MKWFILGTAFTLVATLTLIFQNDYNMHQEQMDYLKFVAQEASAAASQYFSEEKYGDGYLVYDQAEGEKAARSVIISLLKLNPDMTPSSNSYWKGVGNVTYDLEYFDESNYSFPFTYVYTHPKGQTTLVMNGPSVLIRINVGKAKYDWFQNDTDYYRIGVHSFDE